MAEEVAAQSQTQTTTETQIPAAAPAPAAAVPGTTTLTSPSETAETDKPVGGLEGNGQVAKPVENQAAQDNKPVIPEKYDLKLSDGSLLSPDQIKAVETFAKSKGLTQDQAQDYLSGQEQAVKSFQAQAQANYEKQVNEWTKQVQVDSEYGGEKLKANAEIAKRALTRFGGEKLTAILNETGYGDHPEIVRLFYRIGQAMSEGQVVPGGTANGPIEIHDKFYGKKNK